MRTINEWRKLLKSKPAFMVSGVILNDLKGYRQNSLQRAEDGDNVTNAIEALILLVREECLPNG